MGVIRREFKYNKNFLQDDFDVLDLLFSPFAVITRGKLLRRSKRVALELFQQLLKVRRKLVEIQIEYDKCVTHVGGKKFYIDGGMCKILDHFIHGTKEKWDFVMLVTGMEGSAKTTLSKCFAYYMTKKYNPRNTFTNNNIVFTANQFNERVDVAPEGSVILWDEFVLGGLSTDMTAIQNAIIKRFTMIRKKQLFIILVIPYIWMLRSYFAIGRTKLLVNVYSPDMIKRGYYKVWGLEKKKELYFKGMLPHSKWSYSSVNPTLSCRFLKDIAQPNFFTNDFEYEQKKDEATATFDEVKKSSKAVYDEKRLTDKKVFASAKACPKCSGKALRFFVDDKKWKCLACDTEFKKLPWQKSPVK